LWAFDDDAYLPHQIAGDDEDDLAPVLIATPDMDVPLRPLVLNLRDAAVEGSFERVLEVVPADDAAREPLRERRKQYKARGFDVNKHDMSMNRGFRRSHGHSWLFRVPSPESRLPSPESRNP